MAKIECTRCGGYGKVASEVDGGICYKCDGVGTVEVSEQYAKRVKAKQAKAIANMKAQEEMVRLVILPASENTFKDKETIKKVGFKFDKILGWHVKKNFDNKAQAEQFANELGDKARENGLMGVIATLTDKAYTMIESPREAQQIIKKQINKGEGIR